MSIVICSCLHSFVALLNILFPLAVNHALPWSLSFWDCIAALCERYYCFWLSFELLHYLPCPRSQSSLLSPRPAFQKLIVFLCQSCVLTLVIWIIMTHCVCVYVHVPLDTVCTVVLLDLLQRPAIGLKVSRTHTRQWASCHNQTVTLWLTWYSTCRGQFVIKEKIRCSEMWVCNRHDRCSFLTHRHEVVGECSQLVP